MQQVQVPQVTLVNVNNQGGGGAVSTQQQITAQRNRAHMNISTLLQSSDGSIASQEGLKGLKIKSPSTRLEVRSRDKYYTQGPPSVSAINSAGTHLHSQVDQADYGMIVQGKKKPSIASAASYQTSCQESPRRRPRIKGSRNTVTGNGRNSKDQTTETAFENDDIFEDFPGIKMIGVESHQKQYKMASPRTITMNGDQVGLKPHLKREIVAAMQAKQAARTLTAGSVFDQQSGEKQRARNRNAFTTAPIQKRSSISPAAGRLDPLARINNNPFIGPNGIKDLQTVLNAPIDTVSSTQNRGSNLQTSSGFRSNNFNKRAISLGPQTTAYQTMMSSENYSRSQSTARSTQRNFNQVQQQFGMPMALSPALLDKIRQGVGLGEGTERKQLPSMLIQERAEIRQHTEPQATAAQKKSRWSKQTFDYCPDEDSDNDIYTLQVNCPPGAKIPKSKPNNPKQLHTWRQVDKVTNSFIQRIEESQEKSKSPRRTNKLKELALSRLSSIERTTTTSALSPKVNRQTNFTPSGKADPQSEIKQALSSIRKKSTVQEREQKQLLLSKPGKPKFSFEFNQWLEKQKKEDPSLLTNMESVLKPAQTRTLKDVKDAEVMKMLSNRQQIENRGKVRVTPAFQFGISEGLSKPMASLNFGQIASKKTTVATSHTMPISTEDETIGRAQFTSRRTNESRNQSLGGLFQQKADQADNKICVEDMDSTPSKIFKNQSQDESQLASLYSKQDTLSFAPRGQSNLSRKTGSVQQTATGNSEDSKASRRTSIQQKLPITDQEIKYQKMYSSSHMLTHERRVQVFNACQEELAQYKRKRREQLMLGGRIASKSKQRLGSTLIPFLMFEALRIMLGVYWREFFKRRQRLHTGTTKEEDLKQSEEEAHEAVLRRLEKMSSYVGEVEEMIDANPIAKRKLVDEAMHEVDVAQCDTDAVTADIMRDVILRKLEEATHEVIDETTRKRARLDQVILKYGSVQAYKEHLIELKRQYAEDREAMLQKELERKAQEEAEQRKKNEKNSMENQLKVARWINNYDQMAIEMVEREIDVFNDLNQEEMLAGLCLIQDDALEEHNSYMLEKGQLNDLIMTIRSEVNELKKTLKAYKSTKLEKTHSPNKRRNRKGKSKGAKAQAKRMQLIKGGGDLDSATQHDGRSIATGMTIEVPNVSVAGLSHDDDSDVDSLDRDSDSDLDGQSDYDSESDDRQSRRTRQQAASRRRLRSNFGSSVDSVTSSVTAEASPDRTTRFQSTTTRKESRSPSRNTQTASQNQISSEKQSSNWTEIQRQKKREKAKKDFKSRRRWLRKNLKKDISEMEDQIFTLQEKVEDFGLDSLFGQVDQSQAKRPQVYSATGNFNAETQLTHKLDKLFESRRPGVKWEDEEEKFLDEQNALKRQKSGRSSGMKSQRGILSRQDKPMAVRVFEEKCNTYNEKAPTIFRFVKNGVFNLKEITLTPGQTFALTCAVEHLEGFTDKVRLDNNNFVDNDLSDIIQALAKRQPIKQLSICRNELGEHSIKALHELLQKRPPQALEHLCIEGIKMKPFLTKDLMTNLQGSSIRKLSLIQLNMNEESFSYFIQFLEKCLLDELDLQDSRVTSVQFSTMLEVLKRNKTIKMLNLSYNNLVPQGATEPGAFSNYGNSTLEPIAEEGAGPEQIITNRMNPKQQTLVDNLSAFIRRNKKLLHLNLESTGLTYLMIKALLQAIKRSRSLQAIHLCGNPGVNEIALIHDTVELLDPINFSEWDDIVMAGRGATQSRTRRTMHSALTNKVVSRAGNPSSRMQQSQVRLPASSPSRQALSPQSETQTPRQGTTTNKKSILKKGTSFGQAAQSAQDEQNLSDSSDEKRERSRREAPSVLETLHKGLGTKQYLNKLKRKKSSRLEVFEMERSGNKTVTFEQMKQSVQLLSYKKFIITRFMGHKVNMEHSHRWRLYLENNSNLNCWVCEKWAYTMFFWTRPFGEHDQIKLTSAQLQEFEEKKRVIELFVPESQPSGPASPKQEEQKKQPQQSGLDVDITGEMRRHTHKSPIFTASFSNWEEPARMVRLKEFCHYIDKHKVEYFNFLKSRNLIQKTALKYQDLSEKDKKVYQDHLHDYIETYEPEKWKLTLAKKLKYRRPALVNLFDLDTFINQEVWVTSAFVKPGTHTYIVSDFRGDRKEFYHQNMHECTVEARKEDIVQFERITKIKSGDVFNRWKTIFAPWPNENDQLFRQCVDHDIKLWKVTRLIKDGDDYNDTIKVLMKHAKVLNHLFIYLSSKSVFPAIGLMDFGIFCQDSRIVDAKFISSTVDRQFIAATTAAPGAEDNPKLKELKQQASKAEYMRLKPDGALVRFQFLEILVRIADLKYRGKTFTAFKKAPEQIQTYARATEVLIEENIGALYSFESFESIRFNRLWKNDVAGIFKANENLLQQLFRAVMKKKKHLDFEGAYDMVKKVEQVDGGTGSGLSLKDFTMLYAMSKQIIPEESHQGLKYLRTKFLEMVELIGRLTIFKNFNSPLEDLPMHKQIQLMMDELFELHLGVKSFEMGADVDESSGESEDDY